MINLTDQEFKALTDYVLGNYGIDLTKKRVLIEGRLNSVLARYGFTSFTQYIDLVKTDTTGAELQQMLNRLTTNLTYFLRENDHFDYIAKVILPEMEAVPRSGPLRVWSAGCSSGEEPYTLAMTLLDYYRGQQNKFVILATDISQNVLGQAKRAVYTEEGLKDVSKDWRAKYFDHMGGGDYKVKPAVQQTVTFKTFNLMDPFRFSKPLDIIFCRNVMIYFEKQRKDDLIEKFYTWLAPGGYFFTSHSENVGKNDAGFATVRPSIYKKQK